MLSALENLEDKVSLFRRNEVGGETEILQQNMVNAVMESCPFHCGDTGGS